MANTDIRSALLSLLQQFNPALDTTEGSPVDRQVVGPLISRLGVDPFSTDVRSFMLAHLRKELPEIDTASAGGQFRALVLGAMEALFTPFRAELAQIRAAQSMANPSQLTEAEMDALIANVMGQRQDGGRARVFVRVYFNERRSVSITASVGAKTRAGLRFYAVSSMYVASDSLAQSIEGGKYFLDIEMEAAEEGDAYNIGPQEVIDVFGLAGVVSATNKAGVFLPGAPAETNVGLLQRVRTGLGERSPNTEGGISSLLYDKYPDLRDVRVIGYGDPEMRRDIIKGTVTLDADALGYGAVRATLTGIAGEAVDLTVSDATGPAVASLVLPEGADERTFRLVSTTGSFADTAVGDVVQLRGVDRVVSKKVSDDEVHVQDFQVVAKGNSGFTVATQLSDGPSVPYALRLQDAARSWPGSGVAVGDWLRVAGEWAGAAAPLAGDLTTGPGNTAKPYFQVQSVDVDGLRVSPYLPTEYVKRGGRYRVPISDVVGTIIEGLTATQDATTATVVAVGSGYIDVVDASAAGFTEGDAIAFTGGATAVAGEAVIDAAKIVGTTITLHASGVTDFALSPAPQVGDRIVLEKTDGSGTFAAKEWTIASVPSALEVTVSGGTPTACSTYSVSWAIRRSAANGGSAPTDFLLAGTADVEWAVLRYSAGAAADPSGFDWVLDSDSGESCYLRSPKTLGDVAGALSLTISDIPMGVTLPRRLGQGVDLSSSDEVHVGGCSDVHSHQLAHGAQTLDLLLEPNSPLASGTDLVCAGGTAIVSAASLSGSGGGSDCVLLIEEGASAGSYRVLEASGGTLRLAEELAAAFSGTRYSLAREVVLSVTTPSRILLEAGATLSITHQSNIVTDASVDFSALGVLAGDRLTITAGVAAGDYSVAALVDSHTLRTSARLPVSTTGVHYTLLRPKTGPMRPFRRVTDVELLAQDGTLTGIKVPLRDPLVVRGLGFDGSGRGRTFTRTTFQVYFYTSWGFAFRDISDSEADSDLMQRVASGDVFVVDSGPNAGEYLVYWVTGNVVWLYGHGPANDSLVDSSVPLSFTNGVGTLSVGNVVSATLGMSTVSDVGEITSITYATSTTGTLVLRLAENRACPVAASTLSLSGNSVRIASFSATVTATIGPAAVGTGRVYVQQPTVLELRNRGASHSSTTVVTTADGRRYVPDPFIQHTYYDGTGTETDRFMVATCKVLALSSVVGTFLVGDILETSAGADLGTIVYVSGSGDTIWVSYTGPGTVSASTAVRSAQTTSITATVTSVVTKTDLAVLGADIGLLGVEVGDIVEVLTVPLTGTVDLAAGINASGVSFSLTVGGGAAQVVQFSGDNPLLLTQASPPGLVQQINAAGIGVTATVYSVGSAQYLRLHSPDAIVVGTSTTGNTLLGFTAGQSSASDAYGRVLLVSELYGETGVLLESHRDYPASLASEAGVTLRVKRPGTQRVSPSDFIEDNGVWYADVRLRSVRTGDAFNEPSDSQMAVTGHRSLGYRLVSLNDALSYSSIEDTNIEVSALLLDPDLEDTPENLITLSGKRTRITYELADNALASQSLLVLPKYRVVNNNPLAKVLRPAMVSVSVRYSEGPAPAVVRAEIADLLNENPTTKDFDVADIYGILTRRGASRVNGDIEVRAVCHNVDRSVGMVWAKSSLALGRTCRTVPDMDHIKVVRQ